MCVHRCCTRALYTRKATLPSKRAAHEEPGPHWKTGDVHLHFLTEKENARIS